MEEKKYEFTKETNDKGIITLYRIKALKSFGDVKKGDLGGWIESEDNLSQEGDCWVYDNAKVCSDARVYGNAQLRNYAMAEGKAEIYGEAIIKDYSHIYDNAKIYGNAKIHHFSTVRKNAKIYENAILGDRVDIDYDSIIRGNASIGELTTIRGNAEIKENSDYLYFRNTWYKDNDDFNFVWTKNNNMWTVSSVYNTERFYGTGDELIKRGYEQSEESGKKYAAYVKFVEEFNKI